MPPRSRLLRGFECRGIFWIRFPPRRIVLDVPDYRLKRCFVTNDVFIETSLPDNGTWGPSNFIEPFGRDRFERSHQSSERFFRRGGSRTARSDISDGNNSMKMIWHYNRTVRIAEDAKHAAPDFIDDPSGLVQDHFPVEYLAEESSATISTDGYEI